MTYTPDYPTFVESRLKDGGAILKDMTPEKADLIHLAMLISGEAGEILDAIKKHVIYNKPLDIENLDEECGDILFGITALLSRIGRSEDGCKSRNVEKLMKRYATGYSDRAAQERADK